MITSLEMTLNLIHIDFLKIKLYLINKLKEHILFADKHLQWFLEDGGNMKVYMNTWELPAKKRGRNQRGPESVSVRDMTWQIKARENAVLLMFKECC